MEVATTVPSEVVATAGLSGTPATSGKGSGPSFDSVLEAASDRLQTANGKVAAEVPRGSGPPTEPDGESDSRGSPDQAEDTAAAAAAAMMASPMMASLASEVVSPTAKNQGGEDPMAVSTVAPVQVDGAQGRPSEVGGPQPGSPETFAPVTESGNETGIPMTAQAAAEAGPAQAAGSAANQAAAGVPTSVSGAAAPELVAVQTPRIDSDESVRGKGQDGPQAASAKGQEASPTMAPPVAQGTGTATSVSQYQTEAATETKETKAGVVDGFGRATPITSNGAKAVSDTKTASPDPKGGAVAGDSTAVPADTTVVVETAAVIPEARTGNSSVGSKGSESVPEDTTVSASTGGSEPPKAATGNNAGDSAPQGGDQGKTAAGASGTGKAGIVHRGEDRTSQGQDQKTAATSQDSSATASTAGPSASTAGPSAVGAGNAQGSDREPVQAAVGKSGEQPDARIASLAATRTEESGATHAASAKETGNNDGSQAVEKGLFDQLLANAAKLSVPRNSSMRVQLKPESLGQLDLRLGLRDGVLTLQILTESQRTRDMIQGALPQLRQALESRSIDVGQMSLGSLVNNGAGSWQQGFAASSGGGQWLAGKRYAGAPQQPSLPVEASSISQQPVSGESGGGRHLVDYRV